MKIASKNSNGGIQVGVTGNDIIIRFAVKPSMAYDPSTSTETCMYEDKGPYLTFPPVFWTSDIAEKLVQLPHTSSWNIALPKLLCLHCLSCSTVGW